MNLKNQVKNLKLASNSLLSLTEENRVKALKALAQTLLESTDQIIEANAKDLEKAQDEKLKASLIDRLTLTKKSIQAMSESCLNIAAQKSLVHEIISSNKRTDGLLIQKERIPIGVIALIFESRPNVIIDAAALCIKSGNALVLKGGKEAHHSNEVLFKIAQNVFNQYLIKDTILLISSRDEAQELLTLHESIDVIIPRGGEALVKFVKQHATMPVIAHDKGLCHLYVNDDAILDQVVSVVLNAKAQRPGVCNALESLLIHQNWKNEFKEKLFKELIANNVELRVSDELIHITPNLKVATPEDFETEYLDLILSVKSVKDVDEAISHINQHGSHHTEGILAQDPKVIEYFLNHLDASCITINASTRFNDGGELGLGAELGISTSKLHAYGPMGAAEMTTTRFIVTGNGHIRK